MAEAPNNTLGAEIRRTRKSMGMTLQQFAVHVDLPWQTLQAYETGATLPPADRFLRIIHATRRAPEPFRVQYVARQLAAA